MSTPFDDDRPIVNPPSIGAGGWPRAEAAMRVNEEYFRALFNMIDQGFCTVKMIFDEQRRPIDYLFLEVNPAFERHTGLVNATGWRMRALRPDIEEHWVETYGRIALTGEPERFENYAAALGRWFSVYAFRIGAPEQHCVAILFDDITARKRAEQALRDSETLFRTVFESMKEGFVIGTLIRDAAGEVCDSRYLEVAPSFYALTGLAPDAVVGRTISELFGRIEDTWLEAYRQAGRGIPTRTEGYFAPLGRWFETSFTPLGEDRVAILFSDVTERRRRERDLIDARAKADAANISKSKFLAAASHDLRQPVQSLLLFSQALATKFSGHPAQGMVAQMSTALDTLKDLLDSLLDLSRLDAGLVTPEIRPHSMAALLRNLADAYRPRLAAKGLTFKARIGDEYAMTDATLLGRIISNLLDNALKYTLNGGVLLVSRRSGDRVRIAVTDSGVGIPREHFGEIFDEFVQVGEAGREQKQGMGLGLAMVKRLVELLGGEISVRSKPGLGSSFTLSVPAADARPEADGDGAHLDPGDRSCRVLVVDDDAAICEGMRALLETVGYEVATATRADDAYTALTADRPPDAVVADYRLGGAVTGIDLIAEVRRRTGLNVPGIVMTGDTGIGARPDLTVLHKPVAPDRLKKLLAEMCR